MIMQRGASPPLSGVALAGLWAFVMAFAGPAAAQAPSPNPQPGLGQSAPPSVSAPGRILDLSSATCAQFMALSRVDRDQIVLWLAGFYAGGAQRPRIDVGLLASASRAMDELCARTPAAPLIGQETRPLLFR